MSVSFSCHCEERKKPIENKNWIVLVRKGNYSYFEYPKGQFHHSNYSLVFCKSCKAFGRTKAKYVELLRDGNFNEIK